MAPRLVHEHGADARRPYSGRSLILHAIYGEVASTDEELVRIVCSCASLREARAVARDAEECAHDELEPRRRDAQDLDGRQS